MLLLCSPFAQLHNELWTAWAVRPLADPQWLPLSVLGRSALQRDPSLPVLRAHKTLPVSPAEGLNVKMLKTTCWLPCTFCSSWHTGNIALCVLCIQRLLQGALSCQQEGTGVLQQQSQQEKFITPLVYTSSPLHKVFEQGCFFKKTHKPEIYEQFPSKIPSAFLYWNMDLFAYVLIWYSVWSRQAPTYVSMSAK